MDLSIKTGDVLILFLLKMILFTIFLSIHHLEGIAEVVFCFFKEGNAKSIIYKIMNDFTNEHSHLLFFLFFGISNCHAPEGKWMFFSPHGTPNSKSKVPTWASTGRNSGKEVGASCAGTR